MKTNSIFGLILFFVIGLTLYGYSDEVHLNNGDILVGEIVTQSDFEIRVKGVFGEVAVPRTSIKEIKHNTIERHGEEAEIIMKKGTKLRGKIIDSTDTSVKVHTELGIMDIQRDDIARITYAEDMAFRSATKLNFNTNLVNLDNTMDGDEILGRIQEYQNRSIHVEYVTKDDSRDKWVIRQGRFHLAEDDFLSQTENYQQASYIERLHRQRIVLFGTFVTLSAAGLTAAYIFALGQTSDAKELFTTISLSSLLGGIALGITSFALRPNRHYLTYGQAATMAQQHNIKLRQSLNLTREDIRESLDAKAIRWNDRPLRTSPTYSANPLTTMTMQYSFRF